MPIIRSSQQPRQTLEAFYEELSATCTNAYANAGRRMLALLRSINESFPDMTLYGLTSHARLVLLAEDNCQNDWLIILASAGLEEYYIEYLLPEEKAPWPGATVRGTALSLDMLMDYLQIAIRECEGWPDR